MSSIISKLINLAGNITGTLPVANGGTGLASGTSGGVLGYTASGTLASSGALTANGVVLGGGAGATPTSTAAGTAGQLLVGVTGSPPAWGNTVSAATTFSGQLIGKGTTTNDNAAAGYIGEVMVQSRLRSAATAVTSGTVLNVTATKITLTAGDWDVSAMLGYTYSNVTVTSLSYGVSLTSATLPATDTIAVPTSGEVRLFQAMSYTDAGGGTLTGTIPSFRVSVSGSTDIYLVATASFTGTSVTAYGSYWARRMR